MRWSYRIEDNRNEAIFNSNEDKVIIIYVESNYPVLRNNIVTRSQRHTERVNDLIGIVSMITRRRI